MEKGTVVTFRWNRRKRIGKDWAQVKRNTKKIADVEIKQIKPVLSLLELEPYVSLSGFSGLKEWGEVIDTMRKPKHHWVGWLYSVTRDSQQLRRDEQ